MLPGMWKDFENHNLTVTNDGVWTAQGSIVRENSGCAIDVGENC